MKKCSLAILALVLSLASAPAVRAADPVPKNCVLTKDGKVRPAAGYDWANATDPKDLTVRWKPGLRHAGHFNVIAAVKEGVWNPAPGFKWLNDTPGDLRVVKAGPTPDQLGRGALKAFGALALHAASKPQRDDGIGEAFARGIARAARDELLDSAIGDLFPDLRPAERASIRHLAIVALDGELPKDRAAVLARLRKANPGMANDVEAAEFLILLARAIADR